MRDKVEQDLEDLYWRMRQIDEAIRTLEEYQELRRQHEQMPEYKAIAA